MSLFRNITEASAYINPTLSEKHFLYRWGEAEENEENNHPTFILFIYSITSRVRILLLPWSQDILLFYRISGQTNAIIAFLLVCQDYVLSVVLSWESGSVILP